MFHTNKDKNKQGPFDKTHYSEALGNKTITVLKENQLLNSMNKLKRDVETKVPCIKICVDVMFQQFNGVCKKEDAYKINANIYKTNYSKYFDNLCCTAFYDLCIIQY